jgi:hypothetical protein
MRSVWVLVLVLSAVDSFAPYRAGSAVNGRTLQTRSSSPKADRFRDDDLQRELTLMKIDVAVLQVSASQPFFS